MSVLLDIKDTRDGYARRVFVRDGQALTLGSDAWNDVTLGDDNIAGLHFRITCQPDAEFQVVPDAETLRLNKSAASEGALNQDDVLEIGPFQIRVLYAKDSKQTQDGHKLSDANSLTPTENSTSVTTCELVDGCRLTADQEQRFSAEPNPDVCLDDCLADGDWNSAAMILLGLMTEMQRLDWLLPLCIPVATMHEEVSRDAAIDQLQEFRQQPDEAQRRDLNKIGRQLATKNPWRWLMCMVFWAGDSLGPADVDPIPPAGHLPIVAGLQVLQLFATPDGVPATDARLNWIREGYSILQSSSAVAGELDSSD